MMAQGGHRKAPDRLRQDDAPVTGFHPRHLHAAGHSPPPKRQIILSRRRLHPLTSPTKCNRMIPYFLPFSQCFSHLPAMPEKI